MNSLDLNNRHPAKRPACAFTLIELLVVIAIIGILAAILMPALAASKRKATQAGCQSNFHQVHLGVQMFVDDNSNLLPPGNANPNSHGLWWHEGAAYSSQFGGSTYGTALSYYIAPYLGCALPDSTLRYVPAMLCPGITANSLPGYSPTNTACFILQGTTTDTGARISTPTYYPFGDPSGSATDPTYCPKTLEQVGAQAGTMGVSMSDVWYISDYDLLVDSITTNNGTGLPLKPSHGSVRNHLYYDGHVGVKKVNTAGGLY